MAVAPTDSELLGEGVGRCPEATLTPHLGAKGVDRSHDPATRSDVACCIHVVELVPWGDGSSSSARRHDALRQAAVDLFRTWRPCCGSADRGMPPRAFGVSAVGVSRRT
jgi:hypothetical protein